jgi:hypothetical protein
MVKHVGVLVIEICVALVIMFAHQCLGFRRLQGALKFADITNKAILPVNLTNKLL